MDHPAYNGTGGEYPSWPEVLATCRLPDTLLAEAYDTAPPQRRAGIKTSLACLHALFGEQAPYKEEQRKDPPRGFHCCCCQQAAEQVLAVITPAYASAPRLAAALMPAILAGVPLTALACLGGIPSPEALLVMELGGIEDIFLPDTNAMAVLLAELCRHDSRLLLFHQGELDTLRIHAVQHDIPVWEERHPPRLLLLEGKGGQGDCAEDAVSRVFDSPDIDAIRWGHPDAELHRCTDLPADVHPDAIFCSPVQKNAALQAADLILLPSMESCWLHPRLTPDFFRRMRYTLAPLPVRFV